MADVEILERQHTGPDSAGEASWFGFKEPGGLRRRIEAHDTLTADRGMLVVVDDDAVVGEVSWLRVFNGPPPSGDCWNIGIWVVPEHRGKGYGTEAQRLAAAYLFEHTYLERVEAGTESGNIAEQRALEKAGFQREGVLRGLGFVRGQFGDGIMYSRLRSDPHPQHLQ